MKPVIDEYVLIKNGEGQLNHSVCKNSFVSNLPVIINYNAGTIKVGNGFNLPCNFDSDGDGKMDSTIVTVSYMAKGEPEIDPKDYVWMNTKNPEETK